MDNIARKIEIKHDKIDKNSNNLLFYITTTNEAFQNCHLNFD
jgi:hypothetical protein